MLVFTGMGGVAMFGTVLRSFDLGIGEGIHVVWDYINITFIKLLRRESFHQSKQTIIHTINLFYRSLSMWKAVSCTFEPSLCNMYRSF